MRSLATLKAGLLGLVLAAPAFGQATTQALSGVISADTELNASEVYLLDGEVYVESGVTLTIPAGTVIKGKQNPTDGNGEASVLVIQRGGTIDAQGTAVAPIIFTAEADDVTDAFDTNESQRGLWGGVVILGNATNNRGERQVEGIAASDRTKFGPSTAFPVDDADDSGIMRYVSIRHAGFTRTPNEEINGLTLGAVGSGTTLEYIEVFANSDDSFEFFGGTVNAKYLVGIFGGDDDIDWDQGYTGKLQFVFSIKDESGDVGRCIEGDGASNPFTATPLSNPTISNMTCIGSGVGSSPGGSDAGGPALKLRENTWGAIYNSVFTAVESSAGGIDLEPQAEDGDGNPVGGSELATSQNFREGELIIENNIFFDFSVGNDATSIVRRDETDIETTIAASNRFVSPGLVAINDGAGANDDARAQDAVLDPRPAFGAAAASGAAFTATRLDDFFTEVDYLGAFAPRDAAWADGWTALSQMGYFADNVSVSNEEVASSSLELTVGPNPATHSVTVRYALNRAQDVRVALYDVLGREVAVVAEGGLPAGAATSRVETASLPVGVYVLRLQAEDATLTRTLTVVR